MRFFLIFIIFNLLWGCGKNTKEEVAEAVDVAQTYLSRGKCEDAIEVLEEVGRQVKDPVYLQVLASAYSCRAGFNAVRFIANDIPNINTSTQQTLMRSLSILTYSDDTTTDSSAYQDLRTALDILLTADGGGQPSQSRREDSYGVRKAGDMGMQILVLSIVQLGKFLNHYGNVDAMGDKGDGTTNTNKCFLNYSYAAAQTVVTSSGGVCNAFNLGHPDLSLTVNVSATRRRLCEGLMLITNIIDVLENIDLSGSSTFGSLENVATLASQFKTAAIAIDPALGTLLNLTSQSQCLTTLDAASELNNMQLIYASIFEAGLQ